MENRAVEVHCSQNPKIVMNLIPGHFATAHAHVNYYMNMANIRHKHAVAKMAAECLARKYIYTSSVDTIACIDDCEVIGAFLADELSKSGFSSINEGTDISVVTPEYPKGQFLFRDNVQSMILNKNVLLLVASTATGETTNRLLECIRYYGGRVTGIAAIFSAVNEIGSVEVNSIFTAKDLPEYRMWAIPECPYCKKGQKIDAIVNSYGYSKV